MNGKTEKEMERKRKRGREKKIKITNNFLQLRPIMMNTDSEAENEKKRGDGGSNGGMGGR